MSDNQNFGFGKFVPGFDFLQNLAKGASQTLPQMPSLSNWVAPTLSLEELEKRIGELKAVNFWLDQNSRALCATIQALEVQKMTLATLKGMNFDMGELADALTLKPKAGDQGGGKPVDGVVDPMQWWGALTQQFQEIAAGAMKGESPPQAPKPAARASKGAGAARKPAGKRSTGKPAK
jgi:hypothetical protein